MIACGHAIDIRSQIDYFHARSRMDSLTLIGASWKPQCFLLCGKWGAILWLQFPMRTLSSIFKSIMYLVLTLKFFSAGHHFTPYVARFASTIVFHLEQPYFS